MKKIDPLSNYICSYLKEKKLFFFRVTHQKKSRGGKPKSHKKQHFFDLTEISGRFFGRKFGKSADGKFLAMLTLSFFGFKFGPKTKKLCKFKVRK